MRLNDILLDTFEEVKIFNQYLYLSEDHSITIKNSLGVPLEISMDDNLNYWCQNLNFPDTPKMNYNSMMDLSTIINIISELKEYPPEMYDTFDSRWDEISHITLANCGLNKMHRKRR